MSHHLSEVNSLPTFSGTVTGGGAGGGGATTTGGEGGLSTMGGDTTGGGGGGDSVDVNGYTFPPNLKKYPSII